MLEWRSESSETFVFSTSLFFFSKVCSEVLVKIFYILILYDTSYFASLSIDIFLFSTRYSLRYLSLKFYISSIQLLLFKLYGIRFWSEIIIYPFCSYREALTLSGLTTLKSRRESLTTRLFKDILEDPNYNLHGLLPPMNETIRSLRRMPLPMTKRF